MFVCNNTKVKQQLQRLVVLLKISVFQTKWLTVFSIVNSPFKIVVLTTFFKIQNEDLFSVFWTRNYLFALKISLNKNRSKISEKILRNEWLQNSIPKNAHFTKTVQQISAHVATMKLKN